MKTNHPQPTSQRNKTLLSKAFKQFGWCTAICFIVTAPLFYLLTKYYYAEDMIDIIESVRDGQGIPPIDLEQDIMAGMMLQFVLIFAAISLALFITMQFITKSLWTPFDDTLQKVERFNLAQGDIPTFTQTDIAEFTRFNRSLEQLMRKDKETYRIQKEFTENASHELQTPLAVIRGKLDLLMQEDLNESQMKLVSDLYQLTQRMGHLNRNLLLLAKIENSQYASTQEVDLHSIIAESKPLYSVVQNGVDNIHIHDLRTQPYPTLRANTILLESMLKNLIVNALRHTTPDGQIDITLTNTQLSVSNPSTDGTPLNTATMFQRFHQSDTRHKGNGLGLAIVKAICDFHHWTIKYRFEANNHIFNINFNPSQTAQHTTGTLA